MGILIAGYDRDGPAEGNSRMYLFIYALEYWNTFSGVFQLLTSASFVVGVSYRYFPHS